MKTAPDPRPIVERIDEPRQLDPEHAYCPACGAPRAHYLGRMAGARHYRCRACGWTFPGGSASLNRLAFPSAVEADA